MREMRLEVPNLGQFNFVMMTRIEVCSRQIHMSIPLRFSYKALGLLSFLQPFLHCALSFDDILQVDLPYFLPLRELMPFLESESRESYSMPSASSAPYHWHEHHVR